MTPLGNHIKSPLVLIIITLVISHCIFWDQGYAEKQESIPPTQKKNAFETDIKQFDNRIKAIRDILKVAEADENEQTASQLGTTHAELKERNALLKNLSAVYMRLITSLKKQASLKKEEVNLDQAFESEKESMIAESPPFSLTVYDWYLDRLNEATQDEDSAITMSAFYKRQVENTLGEVDQAKKQLRLLKEDIESYSTKEVPISLNWKYEFASVERELKQAMLDLARIDHENTLTEQRLAVLKIDIARKQVQWIKERLTFDQSDLRKWIESIVSASRY